MCEKQLIYIPSRLFPAHPQPPPPGPVRVTEHPNPEQSHPRVTWQPSESHCHDRGLPCPLVPLLAPFFFPKGEIEARGCGAGRAIGSGLGASPGSARGIFPSWIAPLGPAPIQGRWRVLWRGCTLHVGSHHGGRSQGPHLPFVPIPMHPEVTPSAPGFPLLFLHPPNDPQVLPLPQHHPIYPGFPHPPQDPGSVGPSSASSAPGSP